MRGELAVVTGSTAGIGKAIAVEFAAEGARVVVHGRDQERGRAVVERIVADGGAATFVAADLGTEAACEGLVTNAAAWLGGLTVLVNNAVASTVGRDSGIADMDTAHWEAALRVNLTAPMWLCRAAIPFMRAAGHGSIINVSSRQAERPSRGLAAYAASKGGLNASTRALAVDYAADNIRCNTISPGYVVNERRERGHHARTPDPDGGHAPGRDSARHAASRSRPSTFAAAESEYLTGINLQLDGGSSNVAVLPRSGEQRRRRLMHPRVSLSELCSWNWTLDEDLAFYEQAGITTIGASLVKLEAAGWKQAAHRLRDTGLARREPHRGRTLPPRRPRAVGGAARPGPSRALHRANRRRRVPGPDDGAGRPAHVGEAADEYAEAMEPIIAEAKHLGVAIGGGAHELLAGRRRLPAQPPRTRSTSPAASTSACASRPNACWADATWPRRCTRGSTPSGWCR